MLKLTKTGIGLLTRQYRSVLKKCWAINVGIFGLMGKAAAGVAGGVKDVVDSSVAALSQNDVMKSIPTALVAATVMATTLTAMPTEAEALMWCIANSASTTPLRLVADNASCPDGYSSFGKQSGEKSSAFGKDNTASGKYSSAVGYWNTAEKEASSAFGYNNVASGQGSSAFGVVNRATGKHSSAFGHSNYAAKDYTTAIGYQAVANVAVSLDSNNNPTQGIISVGNSRYNFGRS